MMVLAGFLGFLLPFPLDFPYLLPALPVLSLLLVLRTLGLFGIYTRSSLWISFSVLTKFRASPPFTHVFSHMLVVHPPFPMASEDDHVGARVSAFEFGLF
jgi:hypothetical protein